MPLPSSGQISFSQLAAELGNACSNISLRSYSACANLSSPDSIIELRGKSCIPVYGEGVWSTGGAMIGGRAYLAGAGTQNEALAMGGYPSFGSEEYNGTSWSSGGNQLRSIMSLAGAGTQNAGLSMAGLLIGEFADPPFPNEVTTFTEEYNGTSWSAGGLMSTGRRYLGGAGTQNEALAMGGAGRGLFHRRI